MQNFMADKATNFDLVLFISLSLNGQTSSFLLKPRNIFFSPDQVTKGMYFFNPWRHLEGARPPAFKSWDTGPKPFSHGLGSSQVHFEQKKFGCSLKKIPGNLSPLSGSQRLQTSEPQSKMRILSLKNGHFFRKLRFPWFFSMEQPNFFCSKGTWELPRPCEKVFGPVSQLLKTGGLAPSRWRQGLKKYIPF